MMSRIHNFGKTILAIVTLLICVFSANAEILPETLKVAKDGKVEAYLLGSSSHDFVTSFTVNFEDESTTEVPRPAFLKNTVEVGTKLDLGTHIEGSQLILVAKVQDTGHWFYSKEDFNVDKDKHFIIHQIYMEDGTPALIIRFEESLGLGDADYNDQVVLLVNAIVERQY